MRLAPALYRASILAAFGALPCVATSGEPDKKPYEFHSAIPAYWKFANENPPANLSVERFRTLVVEPNLEVFRSVAASSLADKRLDAIVRTLKRQDKQLHLVEAEFPERFEKAWRRFAEHATDLKPGAQIFLLPAPRFAVGGSVRPLGDKDAVIFGTEEIGLVMKSKTGFDVLAQHELTHLHHQQVNPEMRQMVAEVFLPPYTPEHAKLYQVVWLEGLAVYTSRLLNPTTPDIEVLVSDQLAASVKARWPRLGAELRKHLDSSKKADIDAFLFTPDFARSIPARTGYYVGSLIARQLAKKYTFAQLCRLAGPQLRAEVEEALLALEKEDIQRP